MNALARLGRAFIGVDRHTAAKYGFDDKAITKQHAESCWMLSCLSVGVLRRN